MDEFEHAVAAARGELANELAAERVAVPPLALITRRAARRRTMRAGLMMVVLSAVVGVPAFMALDSSPPEDSLAAGSPGMSTTSMPEQQPPKASSETSATHHPRVASPVGPGASNEEVSTSNFSCVERYSAATLAKRKFAFDGEVVSVTSEGERTVRIVFSVRKWYRGGDTPTTTLLATGAAGEEDGTKTYSSAGDFPVAPGSRLLVAGDTDFAWACGFTQSWTAEAAAQWDGVFSNQSK